MRQEKLIWKKTQHFFLISFTALFFVNCNGQQIVEGNTMNNQEQYNIKIILGDSVIEATLDDNLTTKDFISLLPMDVELKDYASTEKITYLPRKLSTEDAPSGVDPSVGDINYYAPWGNIAIFYKDFGYARGLIKLGRITKGIELLNSSTFLNVRIELDK